MENVLIATLGESPVVVTAMYDLLKKEANVAIDRVIVLYPQEGVLVSIAFDLIREALQDKCVVIPEPLPFEDVANEPDSFYFFRTLYRLLNAEQKSASNVYLSLAGGRKNMSALMAILVPLFPCVKGLYHVIDTAEGTRRDPLKSIEFIIDLPEDERLARFLLTDDQLERLQLVVIPYGEQQQVSEEYRARLHTLTDMTELDDWWAETLEFLEIVEEKEEDSATGQKLEVLLTQHAAEQFEDMWKFDRTHARGFKFVFDRMRSTTGARRGAKDTYKRKLREEEKDKYSQHLSELTFHYFKIKRKHFTSVERPIFHTLPKDIKGAKDEELERAIVSELEYKRRDDYRSLQEITNSNGFFPLGPYYTVDQVLNRVNKATDVPSETVLIVPLGDRPMIATQIYTLLTHQGSNICEVVLVYPAHVKAGAELLVKAFEAEGKRIGKEISCIPKPVPDYDDIDSTEACKAFEQTLEAAIDEACKRHSGCQIELALSGGRKGMAALAMFVAQRKDIHYLYHTLISDPDPEKRLLAKIEDETTVDALRPTMVSKEQRNDRLFLRAYEGNGPYTKFVLFKVPVLPAKG